MTMKLTSWKIQTYITFDISLNFVYLENLSLEEKNYRV
jgi:hypothetical protein